MNFIIIWEMRNHPPKLKINTGTPVFTTENKMIVLQTSDIPIIWQDTISDSFKKYITKSFQGKKT